MTPILSYPTLCLVTQRSYARGTTLLALVEAALEGGVNMVQLRGKEVPLEEFLALAHEVREITRGRALFVVNQRMDVALAADADGVQLGEEAMPVEAAREQAGDRLLIGRSVHSVASAREAESQGADFLLVGTIFPTASKPSAEPAGLALLSEVAGAVAIPFLAIGGVNRENVGQVMERGCHGVAVISAILGAADPGQATRELIDEVLVGSSPPQQLREGIRGVAAGSSPVWPDQGSLS